MHFPPAFTALPRPVALETHAAQWRALAAALESTGACSDDAFAECLRQMGVDTTPETLERLEMLAEASGTLAVRVALRGPGAGAAVAAFPGMCRVLDSTDEHCLRLAAVAVGLGRRVVDLSVSEARARGDHPSGLPQDPPHWLLADAATDVDAARLLLLNTAAGHVSRAPAVLIAAAAAAVRAADVAHRLHEAGDDESLTGTIEVLSQQTRAILSIVGGEDVVRRRAADALLA
jgi:hypothetical protein